MTTIGILARVRHTIVSRALLSLRNLKRAHQERRERSRARAMLHGMPDRALKDLGFARCEIDSVLADDSGERLRAHPKSGFLKLSTNHLNS
jgi:uncharacterized protein YjiS (DUF1127 family)